jgi:hypothetical protein
VAKRGGPAAQPAIDTQAAASKHRPFIGWSLRCAAPQALRAPGTVRRLPYHRPPRGTGSVRGITLGGHFLPAGPGAGRFIGRSRSRRRGDLSEVSQRGQDVGR